MFKHRSFFVAATVLLTAQTQASTGAAWLGYPRGARNVAEAGGLGVMGSGLNALSLNSAGLADLKGQGQLQLSHSSWAADIRAEHLGVAAQAPWGGVLGLSGSWIDFGAVQGYALKAGGGLEATQTLRPHAAAVTAAWAGTVAGPGLRLGLGASLLQQSLDGRSNALAPTAEAGLKADLGAGLSLGASLLNLGGSLDGSALPLQGRVGLAWGSAGGSVLFGVELGDQSRLARTPDVMAALRVRLAQGLSAHLGWQQLEGAPAQPSGGLSFSVARRWDLDYAFRQQGDIGATHHLSLGLRWG